MPESVAKPPAWVVEADRWFPRSNLSPRRARAFLREVLTRAKGGERYADSGELVLSELVTNAVVHGADRGTLIRVIVSLAENRPLRIEVHDIGTARRPVPRQAVGTGEESGRGLLLVKSLATRWGCCPRVQGFGKFVWCEIPPADDQA
ncbi:ATP-binding protein [Kitasatospora sp. GAS204B]|uniref:ATP-binding protein n=1 Tax=unclassified Kitasatospora TaxID=2633591 RepID=UPI0024762E88|nr:ATP-binding protein [Kitasatospora sp. GAS204B]MDH6116755.1 anti-sigma regulatory factor (Ser/Thr protein kinase) [Kitasatospora sp. GAS204B]